MNEPVNTHCIWDEHWNSWSLPARQLHNDMLENITNLGASGMLHPNTVVRGLTEREIDLMARKAGRLAVEIYEQHQDPEAVQPEVHRVAVERGAPGLLAPDTVERGLSPDELDTLYFNVAYMAGHFIRNPDTILEVEEVEDVA